MALVVGLGKPFRIQDNLCQALAIAQINKDDAAVVPAALHPAHQVDCLADIPSP